MRTLATLVALACLVGLGAADTPTPAPKPKPTDTQFGKRVPPAKPASDIPIGAYLSMTGPMATFGISSNEGIQLALDLHNAKTTGRKLKIEVLDSAGKVSDAATVVTRLIDNGAIAIIGEISSSLTLAGGQVAQRRGVPMVTPAATNPSVTQVGEMITRACFLDDAQAYAIAKFARDTLRATKIAILYDHAQPYSTGLGDLFRGEFAKLGGTITSRQAYDAGAQDFKPQLKEIAATKPQAIFLPGYYTDVAEIARQARALGITVPLLGGDGWDSEELGKIAGTAIDGYYANHFSPTDPRPTTQAFVAAFRAKFKHDPDGLAALAYDATGIVAAAITKARSHNGADVAAAIRSTTNYDGATGTITIDPKTGEPKKPVAIIKISGGKSTLAATIAPR